MNEIGTFEAKNRLSELLDRVEKGEEITITRHGKPIARLVAAAERDIDKAREAARRIRALRESLPRDALEGLSIKQLVEEGRRY